MGSGRCFGVRRLVAAFAFGHICPISTRKSSHCEVTAYLLNKIYGIRSELKESPISAQVVEWNKVLGYMVKLPVGVEPLPVVIKARVRVSEEYFNA